MNEQRAQDRICVAMTGASGRQVEVLGVSLGGGKIEIREINRAEVA